MKLGLIYAYNLSYLVCQFFAQRFYFWIF